MSTITISRQIGSLGREIAGIVAEELGYRLVGRELINQAARRAGAPEAALAAIDELGLFGICPSPQECQAYHRAIRQVMRELAAEGNVVIVGRAGQVILSGCADVLHVRVYAPAVVRAQRVAAHVGILQAAAEARIQASDRYRRDYLRRYYRVRWDAPELYDLMVNTERLTAPAAADLIVAALAQPLARPPDHPQNEHPTTRR